MDELAVESAFYETHRDEFREKYLNKWLVITGESLWGTYDRLSDAAKDALKYLNPGTFLIHRPADDGKILEIGPRVRAQYPENYKRPAPNAVMKITNGDLITLPYD